MLINKIGKIHTKTIYKSKYLPEMRAKKTNKVKIFNIYFIIMGRFVTKRGPKENKMLSLITYHIMFQSYKCWKWYF